MSEQMDSQKLLVDAVNVLLQTINQLPIEDEEDFDILAEARQAKETLFEVKRAVLSEKWDVNTDTDYIFPIDEEGYIDIPVNVLELSSASGDLIVREWQLYSKSVQSSIFDEEQKVDVVWDIEFNNLPHALRHYITMRAANTFSNRTIGDKKADAFTKDEVHAAYLSARRSDRRTKKPNILNSKFGLAHKRFR